jgi:hypothetical protein
MPAYIGMGMRSSLSLSNWPVAMMFFTIGMVILLLAPVVAAKMRGLI